MKWIFGTILVWLVFVMSLAGWWLYYGITTLSSGASLQTSSEMARHQHMLFTEGTVLLVSLLIGGLALFYFSFRMYKEKSAKEIFFASFTHDLKTAIFRLQLEAEKVVRDDDRAQKLLGHTRKIQLDLENGLDSAIGQKKKLFLEDISLREFLVELHAEWPELSIRYSGKGKLRADRKALKSIFKNLLHNSYVHGEADQVEMAVTQSDGNCEIIYSDNGKVFEGHPEQLGRLREKTLGTGFGLFIVRQWVIKLNGKVDFMRSPQGALQVKLKLPGGHS